MSHIGSGLGSRSPLHWVHSLKTLEVNHFMFADPQSITVAGSAKSMPRVSSDGTKSIYQNSDETYKFTISHTTSGTRIRSMARVDNRAIVTNPLDASNDYDTLSFYVVIDRPQYGFSSTNVNDLIAAVKTWLDSTAVGKLFGKES